MKVTFLVGSMRIHLDNLFNGNKVLGASLNMFLNQNAKEGRSNFTASLSRQKTNWIWKTNRFSFLFQWFLNCEAIWNVVLPTFSPVYGTTCSPKCQTNCGWCKKGSVSSYRNNQNFCFREQKESTHNLFISPVSRYRSTNYESYVDAPIAVVFGLFSISFVQISRLLLIIFDR